MLGVVSGPLPDDLYGRAYLLGEELRDLLGWPVLKSLAVIRTPDGTPDIEAWLDSPARSGKLAKLAERTHVQEGTLARSLLSTALDDADPDAGRIMEILDAIPGAWERTQEGLAQAQRGEGIPLDELA